MLKQGLVAPVAVELPKIIAGTSFWLLTGATYTRNNLRQPTISPTCTRSTDAWQVRRLYSVHGTER